jgi:hypothetical protein
LGEFDIEWSGSSAASCWLTRYPAKKLKLAGHTGSSSSATRACLDFSRRDLALERRLVNAWRVLGVTATRKSRSGPGAMLWGHHEID